MVTIVTAEDHLLISETVCGGLRKPYAKKKNEKGLSGFAGVV